MRSRCSLSLRSVALASCAHSASRRASPPHLAAAASVLGVTASRFTLSVEASGDAVPGRRRMPAIGEKPSCADKGRASEVPGRPRRRRAEGLRLADPDNPRGGLTWREGLPRRPCREAPCLHMHRH